MPKLKQMRKLILVLFVSLRVKGVMRLLFSSTILILLLTIITFSGKSEATALTYNIGANEKACFYVMTDKPGKKIGFYFAVSSFVKKFKA